MTKGFMVSLELTNGMIIALEEETILQLAEDIKAHREELTKREINFLTREISVTDIYKRKNT